MKWMISLYPAWWRARYGDEFAEVLAKQRGNIGMFLDVLGGAVDAHLHPQLRNDILDPSQGEETMSMLVRCAAGGPRLSKQDRQAAKRVMLISSAGCALVYLGLTWLYHSAAPVQAFGYAAFPAVCLVHEQTAFLRKRSRLMQGVVLAAGVSAMYLGILGVCLIAKRL